MNIPSESMDPEAETPLTLPYHLRTSASIDYVAPRPSLDNQDRKDCAVDLEKYVQKSLEGFSLRCEHVATILLAPMNQFEKKNGALWTGSDSLVPSVMMKERLDGISPFCKHCKKNILTLLLQLTNNQ